MSRATKLSESGPFHAAQIAPGSRYELSDGHAILCMPTGGRGSRSNLVGASVLETDPAVASAGVDTGFSPTPKTLRAPDVAVGNVPDAPGWTNVAPPLAVEYADTGQDEEELQARIRDLLAHGTRYVWVVRLVGVRGSSVEGMTLRRHATAVWAEGGAQVQLARVVLEQNRGTGITAAGANTEVTLEESMVRDLLPLSGNLSGFGIEASFGAKVVLRESVVSNAHKTGVNVTETGTVLLMERSIVRDTRVDGTGEFGLGMQVRNGAVAEIRESAFFNNHEAAILVYATGSRALVERSVLRNTLPSRFDAGAGLNAFSGRAELRDVTVSDSYAVGVWADRASASLSMVDSVVQRVQPNATFEN
ncbi:MAG: right-handed parallel beta-helix repeat-containing protein, partial [Myxococcales bacterium]